MWQCCSTMSLAWTSLAPKRRRTVISSVPRIRSGHPFRRYGALEQKRSWLMFTQTCTELFSKSPSRVFSMQRVSSRVTVVSGHYTQWSQMMRSPQSYNNSSSILAGMARWSQTWLPSSSQSSSVTCAQPMASNRISRLPTHPKKSTKLREQRSLWRTWRYAWWQLQGPKAVVAFCFFNCHLPEESINPLDAWQDPFWDVSPKQTWPFTSSRVWVPIVFGQRSQREVAPQSTRSFSNRLLGKLQGICGGVNRRVKDKWTKGLAATKRQLQRRWIFNVALQSTTSKARTMVHLNQMLMFWNRGYMNIAKRRLRGPMQSRANQKNTSIRWRDTQSYR